jgi:hypothetical protein
MAAMLVRAETLEDAVRALVKRVASGLAANEVAHVTTRNLSAMPLLEAGKAQTLFDRGLRKRVRNPQTVEIAFTISENQQGFLFVAEIRRENDRAVEMEAFHPEAPTASSALGGIHLEKRLLWEQDAPILDIATSGETMYVLSPDRLERWERREGNWRSSAAAALPLGAVRDPRGKLELANGSVAAYLSSGTCRGPGSLEDLRCDASTAEFSLSGRNVRFTAGRNTLEGTADGWGDTLSACGGVLQPSNSSRDASDSIAVMESGRPVGETVQFPGPVIALWPGALAVVHNLSSGRYAAYTVAIDCGR